MSDTQEDVDRWYGFLFSLLLRNKYQLDLPDDLSGKDLARAAIVAARKKTVDWEVFRPALRDAHYGAMQWFGKDAASMVHEASKKTAQLVIEAYAAHIDS